MHLCILFYLGVPALSRAACTIDNREILRGEREKQTIFGYKRIFAYFIILFFLYDSTCIIIGLTLKQKSYILLIMDIFRRIK